MIEIYKKLGLTETIINARGPVTATGNMIMDPEVLEAMCEATKSYVWMHKLKAKAGEIIANYTGAEAACVTNGSAASLVIASAACMTGTDYSKIRQLPNTEGLKNEIIIQKGHMEHFPHLMMISGAKLVEVGIVTHTSEDDIRSAINEKTAAIAYIIAHSCVQKGMLSLESIIKIGESLDIPVIVDAAAERDLKKYVGLGADLVMYSGGKVIKGPGDIGFICGRKDLIKACVLQERNIARPMKVSKEDIIGLITALEIYVSKDHSAELKAQHKMAQYIADQLKDLPHVRVNKEEGEVRKAEARVRVVLDEKKLGINAVEVYNMLKAGDPSVNVRNACANLGILIIDPTYLVEGQEQIVIKKLKKILTSRGNEKIA